MLDKSIRELDRERMALQNQEKKTIQEIKKMAKEGQMVRPAAEGRAASLSAPVHRSSAGPHLPGPRSSRCAPLLHRSPPPRPLPPRAAGSC